MLTVLLKDNMKNKYINIGIFIAFLFGFGKYLPLFYIPYFIQYLFSVYEALFYLLGFIIFIVLLSIAAKKNVLARKVFLSFLLYILFPFFLSPTLQEINNQITMWWNQNEIPEDFSSPITGMRINREDHQPGEVQFVFNDSFFIYDALIYQPNHNADWDTPGRCTEADCIKIYNEDWYWYSHLD